MTVGSSPSAGIDGANSVRPAATVMLLRDTADGFEVFVLRRVPGMTFAPGMTVFPGGAVDPEDHRPIPWAGPDAAWWAGRLGTDETASAALVVAAVRELFEETGVLLARPAATTPDTGTIGPAALESARSAVSSRRSTLTQLLAGTGMELRADLLRPWANWITPPGRTRRYDTFFFVAALPSEQRAELLTTEADLGEWRTPAALLAARAAGTVQLMPPTLAMVTDLAGFRSVEQVMAQERDITPVHVTLSRPPRSAQPPVEREIR